MEYYAPAVSALLGAFIGGLVTFFVNRANNQTQKKIQVIQYRKERTERLKIEAEKIFTFCFEIDTGNGIKKDSLSEEDHKSVFDKNMDLIKQTQVLVLVNFPHLSDQIQRIVIEYHNSEHADTKTERFVAGLKALNTEKWKLVHAIQEEIKKEESKIL